jgi:hypothetical protein
MVMVDRSRDRHRQAFAKARNGPPTAVRWKTSLWVNRIETAMSADGWDARHFQSFMICMGLLSIFLVGSHSYVTARYAAQSRTRQRGFALAKAARPRPMKMGTIAWPWRYDGLSNSRRALAETFVGSQKRHVAAHGAGWPHPRSRGFTGGGEYRRPTVQLFPGATEPRLRPLDLAQP